MPGKRLSTSRREEPSDPEPAQARDERAEDRGQRLFCWSGPGFNPWVTAERINRLTAKGREPTTDGD